MRLMNWLKRTYNETVNGWTHMVQQARGLGLKGVMELAYKDLFVGRSAFEWIYIVGLSLIPLVVELLFNGKITDSVGLASSITGVLCVIMVSEGRYSNYLFGLISNIIYLYLAIQHGFYGEVMTAAFYVIMQPIGFLAWIYALTQKKESQEFVSRKLDWKGWLKYLGFTAFIWTIFGFIYKGIGSKLPFRDSITDGTSYTGQMLQTAYYREQWIFWIATNVFSIYLWWGQLQVTVMYVVYILNSLYGWYNWSKEAKKA